MDWKCKSLTIVFLFFLGSIGFAEAQETATPAAAIPTAAETAPAPSAQRVPKKRSLRKPARPTARQNVHEEKTPNLETSNTTPTEQTQNTDEEQDVKPLKSKYRYGGEELEVDPD